MKKFLTKITKPEERFKPAEKPAEKPETPDSATVKEKSD